jgi:hypothetical protein
MVESFEDLEALYGPSAQFSEHKRGDHISYIDASGDQQSGTITWVQAATAGIGQRLVVAPDDAGAFLDFVWPADVEACPMKPKP